MGYLYEKIRKKDINRDIDALKDVTSVRARRRKIADLMKSVCIYGSDAGSCQALADLLRTESSGEQYRAKIMAQTGHGTRLLEESRRIEKLRKQYEPHYLANREAFRLFDVDTSTMPTWVEIKNKLSREMVLVAEQIPERQLLLVPSVTRYKLIDAIAGNQYQLDKLIYGDDLQQKIPIGQAAIQVGETINNNELWGEEPAWGEPMAGLSWEVKIVDGRNSLPFLPELQAGKRNHFQVMAMNHALKKVGLTALSGVRAYLAWVIVDISSGRLYDRSQSIVLNADQVSASLFGTSSISTGYFGGATFLLSGAYPQVKGTHLRLLASLSVM